MVGQAGSSLTTNAPGIATSRIWFTGIESMFDCQKKKCQHTFHAFRRFTIKVNLRFTVAMNRRFMFAMNRRW